MPRTWVRGHYRSAGGGSSIPGCLVLSILSVIVLAYIAHNTDLLIYTLFGLGLIGSCTLIVRSLKKRREEQRIQAEMQHQQAQAYYHQQMMLQQAQVYGLPPGRSISQETKIKVSARDGGRCVQCGSPYDLQYDHIIPFSRGGGNGPENIQLLCGRCNKRKYNRI